MRIACPRIVVPVLAAVVAFGIARANAKDPPVPVDPARLNERYAIEPGSEKLIAEMLGQGRSLAGGCTLDDGNIERTSVLATYTCPGGQVVLQLLHPASTPPDAVRTERFGLVVKSGAPPAGLVESVAQSVRAREASFGWTEVGGREPVPRRWPWAIVGGAVAAILALWALRLFGSRRERRH